MHVFTLAVKVCLEPAYQSLLLCLRRLLLPVMYTWRTSEQPSALPLPDYASRSGTADQQQACLDAQRFARLLTSQDLAITKEEDAWLYLRAMLLNATLIHLELCSE